MSVIEKVVSKYVELIPNGKEFKAICPNPEHKENTPSFTVVPEGDFCWCFGCGLGGDAIEFVKKIDGVDYKQAKAKVLDILEMTENEFGQAKAAEKKKDKPTALDITFVKQFINSVGYKSNGYRGIRDEINKFYGHLTKLDPKGNVLATYYPETYDGYLVGYKCRNHPKDFSFGKLGVTGSGNQLSGQVKFKSGGKYVLLVGGECYSDDTDILTERGWVNISAIPEGVKVVQVKDGVADFVIPSEKIKKYYRGNLINYKSNQVDILVTPEHKMVSIDYKGREYTHLAKDHPSQVHTFRKVVELDLDEYPLTDDQLKFIVAYSADSKVDTRKSGKRVAHFNFIKEHKIERLTEILDALKMKYTAYGKETHNWKDGKNYHTFNVTLEDWVPVKGIPAEWVGKLSLRQKKVVLEELIYWDGNRVTDRNCFEFSSKNLCEVETVQALAVSSGHHAAYRQRSNAFGVWYSIKVSLTKTTASYQSVKINEVEYEGFVYCVTVPKGQIVVRRNGKVIICGNCDKTAAYQMLLDAVGQGYSGIPVVSATAGENSAVKQCAAQYDWFNTYDNIIIGLDNDKAGRDATMKLVEVLPKDKIKIATWTGKDPNQMLIDGQQKQFVRDFYNAKEYVSSGISSSTDALSGIDEFLTAPKILLPPQMHRIQENLRGGIRSTGAVVNIIGDTSIGKSFFSDTLFYYWIFNSPIVPTIVSLERTKEELAIDLESLHLKKNLMWFKDGQDAVAYRHHPDVQPLLENLHTNENGEPRYYIIDERDGNIAALKDQMMRASVKYGTKLFIIDPLTDFLRSLGTDVQEDFMLWEKQKKKNQFVFINILHTRKPPTDKDGKVRFVTEYDALGSGTFVQSADINIVLNRDKMASCEIERNTTIVDLPKVRGGITGRVGGLFYDAQTRQQYDKEDWLNTNNLSNLVSQAELDYPEIQEGGVFGQIPPDYDQQEN